MLVKENPVSVCSLGKLLQKPWYQPSSFPFPLIKRAHKPNVALALELEST